MIEDSIDQSALRLKGRMREAESQMKVINKIEGRERRGEE
jgi:hypothetical protein